MPKTTKRPPRKNLDEFIRLTRQAADVRAAVAARSTLDLGRLDLSKANQPWRREQRQGVGWVSIVGPDGVTQSFVPDRIVADDGWALVALTCDGRTLAIALRFKNERSRPIIEAREKRRGQREAREGRREDALLAAEGIDDVGEG